MRYLIFLLASYKPLSSDAQISGVINSYFKVTNVIPAYNGIRVSNISGLHVNDRVLIIQMKGADINETDGTSFGNIQAVNGAGLYEFATICGFLNDTVIFERQLKNSYNYTKAVQLVKVPVYSNITVSGSIRAQEWNPTSETGGVLAIAATGTITLHATISADSAGYRGGILQSFSSCSFLTVADNYVYHPSSAISSNDNGTYKGEGINYTISLKEGGRGKQSNGGGGGNNHNSGGGGGANYGNGGNGGRYTASGFSCNGSNVGLGGISLSSYGYSFTNNRLFMGGGGGAGHDNNGFGTPGGKGGGIIFIECNELIGNGYTISANGSQGVNHSNLVPTEARGDGGGGGGAGGTVILNVGSYTGNLSIQAQGANGSRAGFQAQCPGPGGGGGGGVIWSNGVLPANVSVTVAGGMAGIINDAAENPSCELTTQLATAGTNGLVLSDFNITYEPVFNCLGVLPSSQILFWSGRKIKQAVSLKWEYVQNGTIVEIFLQRKIKNGSYHNINSYRQPQTGTYNFTDSEPTFPAVYRLALMQIDGSFTYSRVLEFEEMKWNALKVYPNPVSQHLQVQLPEHSGNISFAIYDLTGRVVFAKRNFNNHGKETLTLSLHQITSGIYFISCAVNGEVWSTKFIKQ